MAIFAFQAKQLNGKVVKGEVDASNEVEARIKIRAQQLIPLKVVGGSRGGASGAALSWDMSLFAPRVSSKDLQVFTRQFATLINSGIAVMQSLELLERATPNPTLKKTIAQIRTDIGQGKKMADAMMKHPKIFDRLYINLVRAGEDSGVLDQILNRLANYIEKSVRIKNKIIGAMYYPVGILAVAGVVLWAILTFVIPKFEELFKSSGQELPMPTQIVIALSYNVREYWWMFLLFIVIMIVGILQYYSTKEGRKAIDYLLLMTPFFGSLLQKGAVARFSRTLSTLLTCGVGILDALDISSKVSGNAVIEETLYNSRVLISEGKSIVVPLSQNKFIPDMVVQMIGVGEQTGAMDQMLAKIADFYEEEVDVAVGAITSIIEPLMMMILGGLIGGIVIAMYLPIFNLASGVG